MSKPLLLDLFCGAGGAAMGYHRAGFTVFGVDINPQRNFSFAFYQGDAVEYLREHGHKFDAIHASPPCQAHTSLKSMNPTKTYACFIEPIRKLLVELKKPYIIENVRGAPLFFPVMLCGSSFGIKVRRHRLFESNIALETLACDHESQGQPIDVSGTGGRRLGERLDGKGGNSNKPLNLEEARAAMGIDWMTRKELSQAIPPAYCEFIGKQLISHLHGGHGPSCSSRERTSDNDAYHHRKTDCRQSTDAQPGNESSVHSTPVM